jgi:hypothetical protein
MSNTDKSINPITDIDLENLKSKGQTLKKVKSEYRKAKKAICEKVDRVYTLVCASEKIEPIPKDEQEEFLSNIGITADDLIRVVVAGMDIHYFGKIRVILNLFPHIDFESHMSEKSLGAIKESLFRYQSYNTKHRYSVIPIPEKIALACLETIVSRADSYRDVGMKLVLTDKIIKKLNSKRFTELYAGKALERISVLTPMGAFQ